jgi:hypothetical protein
MQILNHIMHVTKAASLLALLSLGLLAMLPFVGAHPISPNLNWGSTGSGIPTGGTVTANFGVADVLPGTTTPDVDCPAGAFFSGTLTVTTPGGLPSTFTVNNVPCGTQDLHAIYPTQFTALSHAPANSTTGTYTADWAGSTTALVGGVHPSFSISDNFVAVSLSPPPTVPEFGAPAILVAAIGLVVVAAMKKGNLLHA